MKSKLFAPLQLRGVSLSNRIVTSPIKQYSANEGLANDWHLVHYGKLAHSGAGMVLVETTAVEARGRKTYGDLGLWSNDHVAPLARIATFIKSQGSVPAIRLGHAGRKGSLQRPWEGYAPLAEFDATRAEAAWKTVAPSAIPAARDWPESAAMSAGQIEEVAAAWEAAARRAARAGFEALVVDCGHGYLLHQFLSSLANLRGDSYGGDAARRRTYPLEIVQRLRAVWPSDKPLLCRVSVVDGPDSDHGFEDVIDFVRALKAVGVDLVDCSAGGISGLASVAERMSLAAGRKIEYAARMRGEASIATMVVGPVNGSRHAEQLLESGSVDMLSIDCHTLTNPNWPLHARAELEQDGFGGWPQQYRWWLENRAHATLTRG